MELLGVIAVVPYEADVGDGWRTHVFHAAIVVGAMSGIVEESFPATEQHGHDCKMQFINTPRAEVLPNGGRTAPHQNIAAARSFKRCAESYVDPAVDEMEGGSPFLSIGGRGWCVRTKTG